MRKTLKVESVVSKTKVTASDSVGRRFSVRTDRVLTVGQSILVVNGGVVAVISREEKKFFRV